MAIENWIDEIARKAGQVSDGRVNVTSYPLFEKDNFPESLTVFPCAITFPEDVVMECPDSGPNVDMWRGITEFHLVQGVAKNKYPYILRFVQRIRAVFATDKTLGGRVQYCKLTVEGPSIQGPVVFDPDTEYANQGLVAHWVVRERYS